MSVTTVDVGRVRAVVKAVIEDWIRKHGYAISLSEYDLDELHRMLMEELRSVNVKDAPLISFSVVSHDIATLAVYLPINKVICEATFTAGKVKVYGDHLISSRSVLATVELKSPIEVTCSPKE
ncbi:MAG: hypothetical protein JHC33_13195 [Ignisphaera sp.]|nr:hypothetical protein [Ignisphaera sp.]